MSFTANYVSCVFVINTLQPPLIISRRTIKVGRAAISSFQGTNYKISKKIVVKSHFDPPSSPETAPPSSSTSPPSASDSMTTAQGQGVYPLHRCKIIHWVRHAQGFHNVAGEKDHSAYMSPELFDAQLTPLGWEQVDRLRKHVRSTGISSKVELVVVSPLMRTMQTAVGVFGGEPYVDGIDSQPLMVENTGESNRPAISSLNCPPFVSMELCREHVGVHWCDKRRSISEYKPLFPGIDFSLIESDADIMWKLDVREENEDLTARGLEFLKWLQTRKEKEIAVVTHSGFLIHTLSSFGDDCHPSVKTEICKPFNNCELRSMVIVDRSMINDSVSSPPIDFPGKIPDGPDAPSDDDASVAVNGNAKID